MTKRKVSILGAASLANPMIGGLTWTNRADLPRPVAGYMGGLLGEKLAGCRRQLLGRRNEALDRAGPDLRPCDEPVERRRSTPGAAQ